MKYQRMTHQMNDQVLIDREKLELLEKQAKFDYSIMIGSFGSSYRVFCSKEEFDKHIASTMQTCENKIIELQTRSLWSRIINK
jgi:hypothetical protein